jgi:hypothetical protein
MINQKEVVERTNRLLAFENAALNYSSLAQESGHRAVA